MLHKVILLFETKSHTILLIYDNISWRGISVLQFYFSCIRLQQLEMYNVTLHPWHHTKALFSFKHVFSTTLLAFLIQQLQNWSTSQKRFLVA